MAEVLGVTADYLLNDENDNGRRVVQMKDWELLEKPKHLKICMALLLLKNTKRKN